MAPRTSRATRRSGSIWCWRGCCSRKTGPIRRSRCWSGCYAPAAAQGRTGSVIEIQALRALALAAGGDEPAAVACLAEALTLAWPAGLPAGLRRRGRRRWRALLGRLVAAQRADQAAVRACRWTTWPGSCRPSTRTPTRGATRPGRRRRREPGLVDPLTARELEVLAMLAAGTVEPADRRRAGGHPLHRQEARQPRPGQARRGQPHRGRRPGPRTGPDHLARAAGRKRFHQQVHLRVTSTPPPTHTVHRITALWTAGPAAVEPSPPPARLRQPGPALKQDSARRADQGRTGAAGTAEGSHPHDLHTDRDSP